MVLEGVDTLEHLHAELKSENERCHASGKKLLASWVALAWAQADLAGTKDGQRLAHFLALHDCLSSLPDRSYFRRHVDQALGNRSNNAPYSAKRSRTVYAFSDLNCA